MSLLLDNKTQGKVGDALAEGIQASARVSILSGLFSIYGYSVLKKQLERVGVLRLLIPQNDTSLDTGSQKRFRLAGLAGSEADRRFRNTLNLAAVARECAEWLQKKADIKAVSLPVSQNLFHVQNPDGSVIAIHGSSPFTSAGLGALPSDGYDMNTCFTTPEETESLLNWFDSIWSNTEATRDVKEHLIAQLEDIFASKSPELVYFLTLYNVFREYLGELEEETIIKSKTGIKDTLVWSKLYRFQRDGVLGAIDKIERYNGCIIADSVGLGKTFEALAIIKYYELRNDRVLVLCVIHTYISNTVRRVIWLSEVAEIEKQYIVKKEKLGTLWANFDYNNVGKEGEIPFPDGKKPIDLIRTCIRLYEGRGGSFLDFFAGSGSLAHACMCENTVDNGTRRFITIQLPEIIDENNKKYQSAIKYYKANQIPLNVSEIGKERIHRVIKKLKSERLEKAKQAQGSLLKNDDNAPELDLGFKVFKLDASNIKPWDADFDNLESSLFDAVENIKPDRTEADVLYELLLKYGLDLAVPIEERKIDRKTVYIIGAGTLIVCLDKKINLKVVEGIAALKDELKPEIMRVVFKDSGFADDVVKTNAVQILRQAEIEDVKTL